MVRTVAAAVALSGAALAALAALAGAAPTVPAAGVQCARVQGGRLALFDWGAPQRGWVDAGPARAGAQNWLPGPFGPLLVNVGPNGGMLVWEAWYSTSPVHRIEWTDYEPGIGAVDRCAFGAVPWPGGGYHTYLPGVR